MRYKVSPCAKVLVETSGSDGEHDQEKLHRFLEAAVGFQGFGVLELQLRFSMGNMGLLIMVVDG